MAKFSSLLEAIAKKRKISRHHKNALTTVIHVSYLSGEITPEQQKTLIGLLDTK